MPPQPSPAAVQEAQDRARAQFRDWYHGYHDPRSVVVDTEATGLEGRAFVFDFAVVPLATGQLTPAPVLSFLCQPPENAEWSDAARVMHVGRLGWAAFGGIEAYSAPLLEVLNTFPVLTYGAEYDRDRLRFTLIEAGCPSEFPDFSCVMEAYAPWASSGARVAACGSSSSWKRRAGARAWTSVTSRGTPPTGTPWRPGWRFPDGPLPLPRP